MSDLPVYDLAAATPHLRRPFSPEAIRWKVQATWGRGKDGPRTGGMVVPYIDARLVAERLDAVVPGKWSDHSEPVPGNPNAMICRLTVCTATRSGVGESTHSLKGAESDALKRAGVKFGIGACIYAMNRVTLNATENGGMQGSGKNAKPTLKATSRRGKDSAELTDEATDWLLEMYGRWVNTPKIKAAFGEALDHGDTAETLGIEGADARPPDQDDPERDAAVTELLQLYETVAPPGSPARKKLGKAKFNAQLRAVAEDPEKLAALRKSVEGLK